MIANALSLYTLMPKEMRDALRLFAVFEQGRLDGYDGHCRQAQIRLCTARTSRTTAQIAGVEDLAGTGIADMAIAMAGNRDMRICACDGGVTEGGGSARGRRRLWKSYDQAGTHLTARSTDSIGIVHSSSAQDLKSDHR
jgi:hypothetical protein